uniref:RALBP1 associated Eps domain containing 2 n=1 Tax=Rousettus aegyptiacus TaxID=9407 RepID=A0A7J8EMJ3_ROUAE|nr:RALBP1 associated Eps domain containing 2 [Rousettus aegyptiacus]
MMSKTDGEIRFGNPAELHGTKVQIPYLISEKNALKRMDDEDKQQETQSPTMSPLASPPSSPPHYQRVPLSHGYSKLRSSTEQMHPAPYEARQPFVQPEGPSLGGQGAKPPRHQASLIRSFSVEREPQDNNSNYPDEPWRITEEQREYYVNQFRSLQPNPSSFISATKSGVLPPPPALPPRPCPSQSEQASEAELHPQLNRAPSQAAESSPTKKDITYSQPPSKPIRRKLRPENQATENQEPSTAVGGSASVATMKSHPTVQKQSSKQKKAIQTAIRKNKEANAVLARLNSELQQQLKEVHQERIALENQLEQLRPVTVL